MDWNQILSDSGLSEREVSVVNVLAGKPSMKASEVAKELGVTRLDAYKALEDLQEKGMVSVIADRPMRFTCPRIDQAVEQLIEIRRRQLNRIESSFEEIQSSVESSNFEFQEVEAEDNPKFTILKERVRILGRLEKMGNDSQSDLVMILGRFGILPLCRNATITSINDAAKRGVRFGSWLNWTREQFDSTATFTSLSKFAIRKKWRPRVRSWIKVKLFST